MADETYKFAKKQMESNAGNGIPNELKADAFISDQFLNSVGIYSKEDIEYAKFNNFSRFGRILDPYGRLNPCREYLFFVKPDLHIVIPSGKTIKDDLYKLGSFSTAKPTTYNGMTLNPQLQDSPYFVDLLQTHPKVINELQYSSQELGDNGFADPFGHLLSFGVNTPLPLDSVSTETLDNPATVYGTSYKYVRDSEASDENYSFSLEFVDDKNLNIYHFFKAYSEYHIARKTGFVTPPSMKFYQYKRLHNTMGIYKFIVAEDMETIIYWAYLWGVYPTSVPREAFQDPSFSDGNGLTFTVSFEAAFIEDMNPVILSQFNALMWNYLRQRGVDRNKWLPTIKHNTILGDSEYIEIDGISYNNPAYDPSLSEAGTMADQINGQLPIGALVDGRRINGESQQKYRLRWFGNELRNDRYRLRGQGTFGSQNQQR